MYGGQCWLCGVKWQAIDHVKPLAAGGQNIPCNIRPICRSCNTRKGVRWRGPLRATEHRKWLLVDLQPCIVRLRFTRAEYDMIADQAARDGQTVCVHIKKRLGL